MTRKKQSSDERRASLTDSIIAAAQGTGAKTPGSKQSASIVGAALGTHSEGLSVEVERLRAERDQAVEAGQLLTEIDPAIIDDPLPRDRIDLAFSDESFLDLKRSIEQDGQLIPITVRSTGADRYEVAAGRRRLEACRQLGLSVLARVQSLDDAAMLQLQYEENEQRADISTFERALWYLEVQGRYELSTPALAKRFAVSQPMVVKYLKMARIPKPIVDVLDDPRDISLGDSEKLHKALTDRNVKHLAKEAKAKSGQGTKAQIKAMLSREKPAERTPKTQAIEVHRNDIVVARISSENNQIGISIAVDLDEETQTALLSDLSDFLKGRL